MSAEAFLGHFRSTPDLALQVARLLSQKLRWTAAYAEAIAQYDAAGRLLHILLLYNEQFGEALEAGKRYVLDLSLNQTDLASLVGARREWVNRLLREWERRDLLRYEDGRLTIFDLPRLREERDRRIEADV
jgi:CRP-like cAMP-binding protein